MQETIQNPNIKLLWLHHCKMSAAARDAVPYQQPAELILARKVKAEAKRQRKARRATSLYFGLGWTATHAWLDKGNRDRRAGK